MTDLRAQHEAWFADQQAKPEVKNPCVKIYGTGPTEKTCGDCSLLYAKRFSKTYYKCQLRVETRGKGSDHRVGWPTCSKFQAKAGAT
jgi:hypothetical protein